MKRNVWAGLSALFVSTLACEPVIAIGWRELLIIFGLLVFMFGPPVYRFLRRLEKYRERKDQNK